MKKVLSHISNNILFSVLSITSHEKEKLKQILLWFNLIIHGNKMVFKTQKLAKQILFRKLKLTKDGIINFINKATLL